MKTIRDYLHLIKFEHTIFALPFAYLGMFIAAWGWPGWHTFLWITLAMAAARTLAMGVNRIADRQIDALNPRTASRPLITGAISLPTAWGGTLAALALLTVSAWQLGEMTLRLLPIALIFLVGYSFSKRFTWMSHFILGFTDGLAPVGAWVAVRGSLFTPQDFPAWILLLIVTLWIGGFDLMYACQDIEYDRQLGLHAIPARFGAPFALRLAALCHLGTLLALLGLGVLLAFSWPYWIGLLAIAGLLLWEHQLVKPDDLSQIDLAFFNINSYISLALFTAVLGSILLAS